MRDFANTMRWRDLAWLFAGTLVLIVVVNAIRGEPLVSSTLALSLPLAAVFLAVPFWVIKRRYGD